MLTHAVEIALPADPLQVAQSRPLPLQPDDGAQRRFDGRPFGRLAGSRHCLGQQSVVDIDIGAHGLIHVYSAAHIYTTAAGSNVILVFGSINLDLIFPLPSLPSPGETLLAPAVRIEPGGKGANQALAAARDGATVIMAGAVGRDALADGALVLLRQADIDLSRVIKADAATGCAGIFVDRQGRNVIGVGSGANLEVRADQVEDTLLEPATTLLLQMEVPPAENAALIRRAHARGTRIILNLAPAAPLDLDALQAVDVLVLNETEAEWLASRLGTRAESGDLHRALGNVVVRTLGEQGAEAASEDGLIHVPGRKVVAIDTTGAGDCFTGVLAAALDQGIPLAPALHRANAAAALCCTRAGSQGTMPTTAEIDAALRSSGAGSACGNSHDRGR